MSTYRLVGELGRGAMGVVYRAVHTDLEREVAIKFLMMSDRRFSQTDEARFRREVQTLRGLSHPNIVKILDAGVAEGRPYYVMELLEARDLDSIFKSEGALPVARVFSIFDQLTDALAYVHGRGLLHRDIKCANVMLESSGRVVLMDFGLVADPAQTLLTAAGSAVGTPRYFAPELFRGEQATQPSDQWSLGVAMYKILCGQRPFDGKTMPALVLAITDQPHAPILDLRPDAPPGLAAIIDRMLAKQPGARFASMGEIREALEPLKDQFLDRSAREPLPFGDLPPARATPSRADRPRSAIQTGAFVMTSPAATPSRSRLVALAVVVAGLVALALVASRRPAGPAPVTIREPVCRYTALDRLAVTFTTDVACRWTLECDGRPVASTPHETCSHRLEGAASPWKSPDRIALVAGGQRVDIAPPPSPADLVRRLASLVRLGRVSAQTTSDTWTPIRDALRRIDRSVDLQAVETVARAHPEACRPLDSLVERVSGQGLRAVYDQLRPFVPDLLAHPQTPGELLTDLGEALMRLDFVDALANHLGRPVPFDVQAAMRPTLALALRTDPPVFDPGRTRTVFPPAGSRPVLVYLPSEIPSGEAGILINISDAVLFKKGQSRDRDSVVRFSFDDGVAAGPGGKRLHILVNVLPRHTYIRLSPPGGRPALPVRTPNGINPKDLRSFWLTVSLRGALGLATGRWTADQVRILEKDTLRPHYGVDQVVIESMP